MYFIKKNFKPLLSVCLAAAIFSCNNGETEKKEEPAKTADTTTAVAAPVAPAPAAFTPFDVMEINHSVKDYGKWKPAFDMDSTSRKASGLDFIVIGKNDANANDLTVVLKASDVQKAKAFSADPRLKDVMGKAGVNSKPDVRYWHVIRFNPESKEKKWVVITHKVKDFDTWVKAFDGEGTATRATYGLVDVVLARGIDDPNNVYIVFDINDMEKAKARMKDPALKKLMTDAGVEGAPAIKYYTTAE